jgi:TPR repeat protein
MGYLQSHFESKLSLMSAIDTGRRLGLALFMSPLRLQFTLFNQNAVFSRKFLVILFLCLVYEIAFGFNSGSQQSNDQAPPWLADIQEHVATNDVPQTNGAVNIQALLPVLIFRAKNGDAWCEGCLGNLMMEGQELPLNYSNGLRLLRDSAEKGCDRAILELGERYDHGRGVPKDSQESFHWYRVAAEKGITIAQAQLGYLYEMGLGIPANNVEAMKWYRLAADKTNAFSMMHVGLMYFNGEVVRKDFVISEKWTLPAARLGNARAMFVMGRLTDVDLANSNSAAEAFEWYEKSANHGDRFGCWMFAWDLWNGKGTTKNSTNAIYWATKAASQGVPEAQNFLGDIYHSGETVPRDENLAQEWYQKAIANREPNACYSAAIALGYPNLNSMEHFADSHVLMLYAAKGGHLQAEFNVAMEYFRGDGGITNYSEGLRWMTKSATDEWPMAEYYLGLCYLNGEFQTPIDKREGVKWLRQAAADNCLLALQTLGAKLVTGTDMPLNHNEGIKWFRRGAELGDAKCQNDLGFALQNSETETPDLAEIAMWYRLAADQGLQTAHINLVRILPKLTDSQRQEAAARFLKFKPKPVPQINLIKS